MEIEERLARLEAYEAIRQLAAHYAVFVDSRDLDALAELFVPDVDAGRHGTGRRALADSFRTGLQGLGFTILSVTTHVIDLLDAHRATGKVYCTGEIDRDDVLLRQKILYRDDYRFVDSEGWRFVRREHLLWYSAPLGDDPRHLPPANWPRGHIGRGTVPEVFPSWQRFGADPADD